MLFIGNITQSSVYPMILSCRDEAVKSTCLRSRCGAIIAKNDQILGRGFNRSPCGEHLHQCKKDGLPSDFKSDKTCCMHAEQMAILDAYEHGFKREDFAKSTMFFVRIDDDNDIKMSGRPYCTICSKMWMEASNGEGFWVLLHDEATWGKEGYYLYGVKEYNDLSFAYRNEKIML